MSDPEQFFEYLCQDKDYELDNLEIEFFKKNWDKLSDESLKKCRNMVKRAEKRSSFPCDAWVYNLLAFGWKKDKRAQTACLKKGIWKIYRPTIRVMVMGEFEYIEGSLTVGTKNLEKILPFEEFKKIYPSFVHGNLTYAIRPLPKCFTPS